MYNNYFQIYLEIHTYNRRPYLNYLVLKPPKGLLDPYPVRRIQPSWVMQVWTQRVACPVKADKNVQKNKEPWLLHHF